VAGIRSSLIGWYRGDYPTPEGVPLLRLRIITMAAKLHKMGQGPNGGINYVFHCPGCQYGHPVEVPRWIWNGSYDHPTFQPSLLCNGHDPKSRCHSYIKDGKIQFLSDCYHPLADQTVDIPDWED
jgi:hypothetical protein